MPKPDSVTTIPKGWKLVPEEPTAEMNTACKNALKDFLTRCPESQKKRFSAHKDRGIIFPPKMKAIIRYKAMLAAAPEAPCLNQ